MQNQQQTASVQQPWAPAFKTSDLNHAAHQELASMPAAWTAHVPAAATTVLALDLLLQAPCLDLQAAAGVILSDVGATLQVLRLAGIYQLIQADSLFSIQDCLAALNTEEWFSAIAGNTLLRSPDATKLNAVWQHSRLVAQYAQVIAESLDGISPESAYMVGLLHEIETISLLLGHDSADASQQEQLLLKNVVPAPVLAALADAKNRAANSAWRYVLSSAHSLASAMPQFVPHAARTAN